MKSIPLQKVFALGFLSFFPVPLQEPVKPPTLRSAYQADSWLKGPARAGCRLDEINITGFVGSKIEIVGPSTVSRSFADAEGKARFCVEVMVEESSEASHQLLLKQLGLVSSGNIKPTLASLGISAGEIGFAGVSGAGPGRLSWLIFVRGNVLVRVKCFDPRVSPHPDLGQIAQAVDEQIQKSPVLPSAAKPPRPMICATASASNSCKAGRNVPLEVEIADPANGTATLQWIVSGPGQGYVEKDSLGTWRFHATKAGSVGLTLRVAGSMGTFDSAHFPVTVTR